MKIKINPITSKIKENYYKNFRYTKYPLRNVIIIIDTKEVYIFTTPHLGLEESPALWSNNPSLVDIVQSYFEMIWDNSLEFKQE